MRVVDQLEVVDVKQNNAKPGPVAPVVVKVLLQHSHEVTSIEDAREAILDRHDPQHHLVVRVVFILKGELENNVTQADLVPFPQRCGIVGFYLVY